MSEAFQKVFHHGCSAMHTRFSMVLVGIDEQRAGGLAGWAEGELRRLEALLSRFDLEAELAELNRRAANEAVTPSNELWEILSYCRRAWERTAGAFDIGLWPVLQLWRENLGRGTEPTAEAIERVRIESGVRHLQLDEARRTVRFARPGMSLDLGGFGKGYALDRLAEGLRREGVERAFLSFGESSITVLGSHPHGPAWPVGIANAVAPTETVHSFALCDASLSCSGTTPRDFFTEEQGFGETIDPRTGRPIEGYRTIGVAAASAAAAEVLSTALLNTEDDGRQRLLQEFGAISAVEIIYQPRNLQLIPKIRWRYDNRI